RSRMRACPRGAAPVLRSKCASGLCRARFATGLRAAFQGCECGEWRIPGGEVRLLRRLPDGRNREVEMAPERNIRHRGDLGHALAETYAGQYRGAMACRRMAGFHHT